jgi:hypothetical protein
MLRSEVRGVQRKVRIAPDGDLQLRDRHARAGRFLPRPQPDWGSRGREFKSPQPDQYHRRSSIERPRSQSVPGAFVYSKNDDLVRDPGLGTVTSIATMTS